MLIKLTHFKLTRKKLRLLGVIFQLLLFSFINESELLEIASDLLRLAVLGDSSSDKVWCASEIIFSFRLHMSGYIKFKCG